MVRYKFGQQYKFRNDCGDGSEPGEIRSTTFFVYNGCEDCGGESTRFCNPELEGLTKKRCDVIDCKEAGQAVDFQPIEGNAVFWEHLDEEGSARRSAIFKGSEV